MCKIRDDDAIILEALSTAKRGESELDARFVAARMCRVDGKYYTFRRNMRNMGIPYGRIVELVMEMEKNNAK